MAKKQETCNDSYTIDGYLDGEPYQFEYKIEKSKAAKNLELHSNGLVEVPRWLVYFSIPVMIFLIVFFSGALFTMSRVKPDAIYGQSCADRSCSKKLNLKCIDKTCQCEPPKYYTNKCNDLSKYGQTCITRDNCDPIQDMICFGSICSCAPTKYWSPILNKCVDRLTHGQICTGDQCKIRVNLICSSLMTCQCINDNMFYWDNVLEECVAKKKYSLACTSDNQCLDSELTICKNNQYCLCSDSMYFDGTNCVDRLEEFSACFYDDMCKAPMNCDPVDGCKCSKDYFYSKFNQNCVEKITSEIGWCESDDHCQEDLHLECDLNLKICKCSSSYTWSSSQNSCQMTYSYGKCSSDTECNLSEGLICFSNSYDACDCPAKSAKEYCDCPRNDVKEMYWDSSLDYPQCVLAKVYKEECNKDYECRINIEKTLCINEKCECEEPGGWLASLNICKKCNDNDLFFEPEGLCYHFSTTTKKGENVRNFCTLAKIKNFEILDFVIDNVDLDHKYWINGRKDGSQYKYFGSNELINSDVCPDFNVDNKNMLNFDPEDECFKNDESDSTSFRFICEY